jgi:hypothetical protein
MCLRWGGLLGCLLLAGCNTPNFNTASTMPAYQPPIIVRVTGYGAYDSNKDRLSEKKRLMAMRASKLDAYRALAERVYGTTITGNSTVRDFVLKEDGFRTMVDSVIRGAKVISVVDNNKGSFETLLELKLPPNFKDCITDVNRFRYNDDCRMPFPQTNDIADTSDSDNGKIDDTHHSQSLYYLK